MKRILASLLITCSFILSCSQNIQLESKKQAIVLSAIKGEKSKVDTLGIFNSGNAIDQISFHITGNQSHYFKIVSMVPQQLNGNDSMEICVQFQPDPDFIGLAIAQLVLSVGKDSLLQLPIRGMSTKGLEGKNEPPLSWVTKTLGYNIDLGWESLANHIRPDLQGDELPQSLFKKLGNNVVEMIPVARYSPAFELPFGYYTVRDSLPILNEVGVLSDSKSYPEHQTLFPKTDRGNSSFTSVSEPFGFYTTSPSHVAYSEDIWNKKVYTKHAAHACRIYAVKNSEGLVEPNQFLVCFEEAFNGDYQDYVFLVKNVNIVNIYQ